MQGSNLSRRIEAIGRIGAAAGEHGAAFIVVAGDLFDTTTADKATVSAACGAIGQLSLPVYVIPGNHDHGGPGCLWEQDFFRQEQEELAPNLEILLESSPLVRDDAVLLPCPLLRRHESTDPTTWLRGLDGDSTLPDDRPRIVIAHGSVQSFDNPDPESGSTPNILDLSRLPGGTIDYIALGDWHGTKQISSMAWYSGTPEPDRFSKGDGNRPGQVLVVKASRGGAPEISEIPTARLCWQQLDFTLADDSSLGQLKNRVDELIGNRAGDTLLRLGLAGSLGIDASARLDGLLDAWRARLLRLKLSDKTVIAPSEEEIVLLTQRAEDPLMARVAERLVDVAAGKDADAEVARIALRELHATCNTK